MFESSPEDDFNFGAQRDVPIGTTALGNGSARSRGLFRFDIAANVPAGSTITGGTFSLSIERTPSGGGPTSVFELRRMLVPWIEGTKINPERPGGNAPDAGEPTWNHRAAPSTIWGAPGGLVGTDFSATTSAAKSVSVKDTYLWPLTVAGVADLQSWLDSPATNNGWMLLTLDESTPRTARRFYTKETLTDLPFRQGPPPELIIDFTPPPPLEAPEVTVFSYDGSDISLEFFATAGLSYEVEVSTTLEDTGWTSVASLNPIADGTQSVTIPSTAQVRNFVRVLVSDS